jgi:hypothetical protein
VPVNQRARATGEPISCALTAFSSSDDATEDAHLAVTAIWHIAANWVSDAKELRYAIFAHGEHKSVGRASEQEDSDCLRRIVSCGVANHRAILSDARAVCLSLGPEMAAHSALHLITVNSQAGVLLDHSIARIKRACQAHDGTQGAAMQRSGGRLRAWVLTIGTHALHCRFRHYRPRT